MDRTGWAIIAGLAAGCSTGHFDELPRSERQAFERCTPRLNPAVCNGDDARLMACQIPARREYGDRPTPNARRRWLLENGCPPSMVSPDRYLDDDQPVARRAPAAGVTPQAEDPE